MIFLIIPMEGTLSYLYGERGYSEIPIVFIYSFLAIWVILILLMYKKINPAKNKNLQLIFVFNLLIWVGGISAILRNDSVYNGIPNFWTIVNEQIFEKITFIYVLILTLSYSLYGFLKLRATK